MTTLKQAKRRYSGPRSQPFWQLVNAVPQKERETVYQFCCALQDLESRVITLLNNALSKQRKPRVR